MLVCAMAQVRGGAEWHASELLDPHASLALDLAVCVTHCHGSRGPTLQLFRKVKALEPWHCGAHLVCELEGCHGP